MSLILSGTDGLSDVDGNAATPAIRGTDANTGIFFPAADTIAFSEGGAEVMRITSAGDVGIGTSSPASRLNIATGAAASCTMRLTSNNTGTGTGDRGRLDFYSADNSGTAYQLGYMDYDRADGTGTASYIAWANRVSGTVAERMRINSSGNVGIGTTAPTAQLHSIATSGTTTTLGRFEAAVGSYTGTSLIAANTLGPSSTYNLFSCITDSDGDAGGPNTQFLVRGDGLVLINTTTTNYSEQLKIRFPNTQGIHLNESTSSSSVNYQYFTKGATPTNVGAIFYNGSVMAYQTTSDYRLKENIAPMTGALSKIAALKPVTYTWKDNQRSGEGFIAHELQEHFPDAVSGIKDDVDEDGNPKYQGMDASILISTLTAAIQEQQALITALTARITALENPPVFTTTQTGTQA